MARVTITQRGHAMTNSIVAEPTVAVRPTHESSGRAESPFAGGASITIEGRKRRTSTAESGSASLR